MTKVLIIEDDPIIANIYRSRLDKEGFQVEIAPDGQTGFYRIHEIRPDAVLLDLMLPKMDGIQILKKIRAQRQFQQMPVLVFTNAYLPNMVQEARQAGATQVFNKAALTPKHIVAAINQALYPGFVDAAAAIPPQAEVHAVGSPAYPAPQMPYTPSDPASSYTPPQGGLGAPALTGPPPPPRPAVAEPGRGGIKFPQSEPSFQPPPAAPPVGAGSGVSPVVTEISSQNDANFQADLLRSFVASAPEALNTLRKGLHEFLKNTVESGRLTQLAELYRRVHALTGNAAIVGLDNIAQMGAALEALLKELNEKPKNITPSTTRTLAHSIDFLGVVFEKGRGPSLLQEPPINILVVDDEIISRRAVVYALEKARLKSEAIEDPLVAMRLLGEKSYDLIVLDIDMPGMSGFELCAKLRSMPTNQTTPVVFVTGMNDFESRARSSLSGGNDLIAKPFLFIELTVKALTFVLKHRLTKLRPG